MSTDHKAAEPADCPCEVCKLAPKITAAILAHGRGSRKQLDVWVPMEALARVAADIIEQCPEAQRAEMVVEFISSFSDEVGADFVRHEESAPAGAVKH